MALSSEDQLRLNVLLATNPQAIRIDESRMILYGLSESGEAKVPLHPNCRDDQYLKQVRELLSGNVMGSPGGYPVYLSRWTRMGQTRDQNLDKLLLLGEPEAIVAVVCAKGLSDEQARRAWWAMPEAENARRMLRQGAVVEGEMGAVLARFLMDYLPFETEPEVVIETLKLVLQPGLIDEGERVSLWKKAGRKPVYYLGFLVSTPDAIPEAYPAATKSESLEQTVGPLAQSGNPAAALLLRSLSPAGQGFLATALKVMAKPANQEVVIALFDAVASYFGDLRSEGRPDATLEALLDQAETYLINPDAKSVIEAAGGVDVVAALKAMHVLSGLGYGVVRPVFRSTTAIGSLMRQKLEPVFAPLREHIGALCEVSV